MARCTTLKYTAPLALVLFLAGLPTVALAQKPATSPRISIVQRGADRLLEDTEHLMSLSKEGREVWPDFKEFVEEIFLVGIDREKPVRIDLIVGDRDTRYVPAFPVADEEEFLDYNLGAFDIESKKRGKDYYELREGHTGWLRFKDGYAHITSWFPKDPEAKEIEIDPKRDFAKDIPATIPNPADAIKAVLEADYDLAAEIVNEKTDAAARDLRRTSFHEKVTTKLLEAIGAKDEETKEDYALRKLAAEQQLEEFERYYADTAAARIGWTATANAVYEGKGDDRKLVAVNAMSGNVDILLEPIAGSDLAAAVNLLSQAPNHFANVERKEGAILSVRLNMPLDPMRKRHFGDFYVLLRPVLKSRVNEKEGLTDAQKQAREKIIDLVIDMLDASAQAGMAEGFGEIAPDGESHTGVAAAKSPNGKLADDIVALLPNANAKIKVQKAVATIGDVTVHELEIPAAELPGLAHLFGNTGKILVGTAPDAVWFAAGPNAMPELKAAIETVAKPNEGDAGDPFVDVVAKLKPWLEVRAKSAGQDSGDPELRKIVLDALGEGQGNDTLTVKLTRVENNVEGKATVAMAVCRVVGRMMAKFTRETLLGEE